MAEMIEGHGGDLALAALRAAGTLYEVPEGLRPIWCGAPSGGGACARGSAVTALLRRPGDPRPPKRADANKRRRARGRRDHPVFRVALMVAASSTEGAAFQR